MENCIGNVKEQLTLRQVVARRSGAVEHSGEKVRSGKVEVQVQVDRFPQARNASVFELLSAKQAATDGSRPTSLVPRGSTTGAHRILMPDVTRWSPRTPWRAAYTVATTEQLIIKTFKYMDIKKALPTTLCQFRALMILCAARDSNPEPAD
jgi:hypothetical protein